MRRLADTELAEITRSTLADYHDNADRFWDGTRDHDVSQNIEATYAGGHGGMEQFRGMESGHDRAEAFVRLAQGRGSLGL